jgi:hypothetical protein
MNILFYPLLILLLILSDVFLFLESSDIRIIGIVCIYILCIKVAKLTSIMTFLVSLVLLLIAFILFIFSDVGVFINPGILPVPAERMAVWTFLFIVVGILQQWTDKP